MIRSYGSKIGSNGIFYKLMAFIFGIRYNKYINSNAINRNRLKLIRFENR